MKVRFILLFLIILTTGPIVTGQYGSFGLTDARQLAMGNTYAINSREIYAAGKNPSLLAYRVSDRKLDILFPNLSVREYNLAKVTDFVNDYFSQGLVDIITGMDGSVLRKAFENNGKLYVGLQIGFLGAGYTPGEKIGSFSFVMKDFLDGFVQLPGVIVNKASSLDSAQKTIYFKDFYFQMSWTRAYELSYGRALCKDCFDGFSAIYAGIGIKYLQGFMYNSVEFSAGTGYNDENKVFTGTYSASSSSAYSDDIQIENIFNGEPVVDGALFMDPVGNGFGIDLGISLMSERGINFGVSLTDAGMINWKGKTKKTNVSGVIRIDSTLTIDDIDSLANLITIDKQTTDDFRTHPTTALHFGLSFMINKFVHKFPGVMGITFEIHQGMTKAVVNPEFPRIAMGVDWKPGKKWPVFLTGISNSLTDELVWSLGIGFEFKFVEIYLASPNIMPLLEGNGLNTISLSACWHFVKDKSK